MECFDKLYDRSPKLYVTTQLFRFVYVAKNIETNFANQE